MLHNKVVYLYSRPMSLVFLVFETIRVDSLPNLPPKKYAICFCNNVALLVLVFLKGSVASIATEGVDSDNIVRSLYFFLTFLQNHEVFEIQKLRKIYVRRYCMNRQISTRLTC